MPPKTLPEKSNVIGKIYNYFSIDSDSLMMTLKLNEIETLNIIEKFIYMVSNIH